MAVTLSPSLFMVDYKALSVKLDEANCIAILRTDGSLFENDFHAAVKVINPFIERVGKLKCIIIHARSFPG